MHHADCRQVLNGWHYTQHNFDHYYDLLYSNCCLCIYTLQHSLPLPVLGAWSTGFRTGKSTALLKLTLTVYMFRLTQCMIHFQSYLYDSECSLHTVSNFNAKPQLAKNTNTNCAPNQKQNNNKVTNKLQGDYSLEVLTNRKFQALEFGVLTSHLSLTRIQSQFGAGL